MGMMARASSPSSESSSAPDRVRLDIWLDVACLFKTRSEAQRACNGGKVDVNDQRAKPHRELRIGETLTISRPQGVKQKVVVRGLAENHIPKAQARELYEDVTPPPTPEEQAFRDLLRHARQNPPPSAPDKRARRLLRQMKERDR
jgi:ribosome-associated heat shock protein Hsp15